MDTIAEHSEIIKTLKELNKKFSEQSSKNSIKLFEDLSNFYHDLQCKIAKSITSTKNERNQLKNSNKKTAPHGVSFIDIISAIEKTEKHLVLSLFLFQKLNKLIQITHGILKKDKRRKNAFQKNHRGNRKPICDTL